MMVAMLLLLFLIALIDAASNYILIDKSIVDAETTLNERDFAAGAWIDVYSSPINESAMESRHRFEGDIRTMICI